MTSLDDDATKLLRARVSLRNAERLLTSMSDHIHAVSELHLNDRIRHLAGKGLGDPKTITDDELRELCGEILRHVRRMEGKG